MKDFSLHAVNLNSILCHPKQISYYTTALCSITCYEPQTTAGRRRKRIWLFCSQGLGN